MRKTYTYLLPCAMAAMALAGCSNDGNQPEAQRKDSPEFSATIDGSLSRAAGTAWHPGDRIGISGSARTNVCYRTEAGDGRFAVETRGNQIYFQDEDEVNFTAYYPWNATDVKADTKTQTADAQKGFDFLWAQAKGKKDAPSVTFTFAHKMAKVLLTFKPGDGMSYDEVKAAQFSLGGFHHTASFNTADGSVTVNGTPTDKWVFTGGVAPAILDDVAKTVSYSLILCPQAFAAPLDFLAELNLPDGKTYNLRAALDFTSANREKDGTAAKNEWVAGRQYNLSLTLHKTDIVMEGCEINPWSEVKGDEIVVD